jgi:hypothetical protein
MAKTIAATGSRTMDIVRRCDRQHFAPKRRIVDRSLARTSRNRRLRRHIERYLSTAACMRPALNCMILNLGVAHEFLRLGSALSRRRLPDPFAPVTSLAAQAIDYLGGVALRKANSRQLGRSFQASPLATREPICDKMNANCRRGSSL